jgi:hypothetical protein
MSATQILNTAAVDGQVDVPTGDLDRALQNMQVKQRKNKRKQKDPNAPKRAASAYMLWLNENRSSIKDELLTSNPSAKITDVTKRAGELWKELDDAEKTPFQEKSEELRAAYHEAMKAYKPDHTVAKKAKGEKVKYDVDEVPQAPEGWNGPHAMTHLLRKVVGVDGKTVRIQKNFDAAVALANEINAAWKAAVDSGEVPSHWKADVMPCAGITKTSTGYDLRLGPDLVDTQEKDSKGGIASWTLPASAPVEAEVEEGVEIELEPSPAHESPPVVNKTPDAPKKAPRKKKTKPSANDDKPAKPKFTPATPQVKPEDCSEGDLERNGEQIPVLFHQTSSLFYSPDNLNTPIAKLDAEGDVVFL